MGKETGISWCHHTMNPWTGCTKVSEGYKFCYAERDTLRWGLQVFGPKADRQHRAEPYWKQVPKWNREAIEAGERRRVFLMSFGDFWEDRPDLEGPRSRSLAIIEECRALDFLVLTKRIEDAPRLLEAAGFGHWMRDGWPANVWAMVSAENDARLNQRAEMLLDIPARVRGLSCEPLVGELTSLGKWLATGQFHWAIWGGESGAQGRPMHPDWPIHGRVVCREHGVAYWWKQWGKWAPTGLLPAGAKAEYPFPWKDGVAGPPMTRTSYFEGDLFGDCPRELPKTRLLAVDW